MKCIYLMYVPCNMCVCNVCLCMFVCMYVSVHICNFLFMQDGAVEALCAHNPEVGRSKLSAALSCFELLHVYVCMYVKQLKYAFRLCGVEP